MPLVTSPITGLPVGAIVSVLLGMVVTGGLHLLLYQASRERYLLFWGLAWFAFAARYAPMLDGSPLDLRSPLNLMGSLRDLLFVLGAAAYVGRRWGRAWAVVFVLEVVTVAAGLLAHPVWGMRLAAMRLVLAATAPFVVAWALVRAQRTARRARALTAAGYVTLALSLGVLPVLGSGQVALLGLLLHLGVVVVPLGIAVAELEEASLLRRAAIAQLEDVMTSVIRGETNLCADCGRVEFAGGEWRAPEEFIRRATTAPVTHGICPACTERVLAEMPSGAAR